MCKFWVLYMYPSKLFSLINIVIVICWTDSYMEIYKLSHIPLASTGTQANINLDQVTKVRECIAYV